MAFRGCSALEVLFLPRSVSHIEHQAFYLLCMSLKLFVLSENTKLANLGAMLIADTKMEEIAEANDVWYVTALSHNGTRRYRYSLPELDRLTSTVNLFLMYHMWA